MKKSIFFLLFLFLGFQIQGQTCQANFTIALGANPGEVIITDSLCSDTFCLQVSHHPILR